MKEDNRLERVRQEICDFYTAEMLFENDNHKKTEIILKREKIMQNDKEFLKALDKIEEIIGIAKQILKENIKEEER